MASEQVVEPVVGEHLAADALSDGGFFYGLGQVGQPAVVVVQHRQRLRFRARQLPQPRNETGPQAFVVGGLEDVGAVFQRGEELGLRRRLAFKRMLVGGNGLVQQRGLFIGQRRADGIQRIGKIRLRNRRCLDQRSLALAEVIDPSQHKGDKVTFGCQVTVEDDSGRPLRYQIVGVDEIVPCATARAVVRLDDDRRRFRNNRGQWREETESVTLLGHCRWR